VTEIAPGVDWNGTSGADEFSPKIAPELRRMDSRIFRPELMGLKVGR